MVQIQIQLRCEQLIQHYTNSVWCYSWVPYVKPVGLDSIAHHASLILQTLWNRERTQNCWEQFCWEHRRRKLCHQPKSRSLMLLCTFPEPLVNWQPLCVSCSLCQGLQPTWRALKPISDSTDGIIPTLLGSLLQDKQRCQPHHVFFSQHHSPMHCRVRSKCLFSLEKSLLEADTVKLDPFQNKCVQLGKMIHPQEQRLALLCNHNKMKAPCQFPLSFLKDCSVCRSAGLYQQCSP